MANQQHLDLLKQGVESWNRWRKEHRDIKPDLSGADLSDMNLSDIRLSFANLRGAHFRRANLSRAYFVSSDLSYADYSHAQLLDAKLDSANLVGAKLSDANFNGVKLRLARLRGASLRGADLSFVNLDRANFTGADLSGADLSFAKVRWTTFINVDLNTVKGLETVVHTGPSLVGIHTLTRSQGNLPEVFLRGAGVPDTFISYAQALANEPIEYSTCFLSYARADQAFADQLQADLQSKGILCWSAPYDTGGDSAMQISQHIWDAILIYDKLLLVLSEYSLKAISSSGLTAIVKDALGKESLGGTTNLVPINLDRTILERRGIWARLIQRTRQARDFSSWKEPVAYQEALNRLFEDLKADVPMNDSKGWRKDVS